MTKKNQIKNQKPAEESRAAEAVTVAWMLATFATFVAELAALGLWLLAWPYASSQPSDYYPLGSLPGLFLLLALITGVTCLILEPIARRVRKRQAPAEIKIFSFAVGVVPLIVIPILMFLARG